MRVLLIEDDSSTARSIELALAAEGIICDTAEVGEEGVEIGRIYDYDIILLDLMLPDIDGYQVLLRLRSAKVKTPILILSGLSSVDQKVRGLGFGADDYLTKPFNKDELIARIQAIVRRSKGHSESVVRFDKVAINLDTRHVEVNGIQVHLTNKEYDVTNPNFGKDSNIRFYDYEQYDYQQLINEISNILLNVIKVNSTTFKRRDIIFG